MRFHVNNSATSELSSRVTFQSQFKYNRSTRRSSSFESEQSLEFPGGVRLVFVIVLKVVFKTLRPTSFQVVFGQ